MYRPERSLAKIASAAPSATGGQESQGSELGRQCLPTRLGLPAGAVQPLAHSADEKAVSSQKAEL